MTSFTTVVLRATSSLLELVTIPSTFLLTPTALKIYGQGGNDSLGFTASLNTSTVTGGTANDTIWISKGTAYKAYGDLGNDTIQINADFTGASVFGGNLSDATSSDGADSISVSGSASAAYATGNGGNDTLYIAGKVLGGSSVYGGQGNDFITAATTVSGSYLTGNLGKDTIEVGSFAKGATIFGGGGFLFDTSTDGADFHHRWLATLSASSMIQANGGNDTIDITGSIIDSTVYGGQGTDYISGVGGGTSISASVIEGNLGADTIILAAPTPSSTQRFTVQILLVLIPAADSIEIGARTIQTSTRFMAALVLTPCS